ncbi:hypothetical protein J8657_17590 [Dickeya oryzae]|uniref:Uncharacterized protein n=1 Tax=Dickeya oryzae TaxID=1240404 RepID=A0ABS5BG23_9GAMM|nr:MULTISPECIES: hypothetical protein [Dickeya]MBP2859410.1 hypothetical protein [Dickeya oryzae]UMB77395.1 hypothetical protein FXN80_02945 [Dickeya fangzhongdai]
MIISLLRKLMNVLRKKSADHEQEWFTNRTGQLSFRPVISRRNGMYVANVERRAGTRAAEFFASVGEFRSARRALAEASIMARHMAFYRYRFTL